MSAHERERLSAWLDGELPAPAAAAVEAHVAACAECAALAAEMAAADARFRESPAEAPAGYFDTFAARVRARVETEPRRATPRRVPAWTWAAAAALLLAVVTPLTLRGRASVPPAAARQTEAPPLVPAGAPAAEPVPETLSKVEVGPAPQVRAAATPPLPAPAAEPKAGTGGATLQSTSARPQSRAAAPAAAAPALLDRAAALRAERQGREESAANERAGAEIEGEGGAPGGVAGGVVSGVPQVPPPAPATSGAVPAPRASAEREGTTAVVGFGADAGEARAKAADAPRRGASPAEVSSEAVARDEAAPASLSFARLAAATPRSAAEWRRARDDWRAFAATHAMDPRADEARARAVEAAFEALRAGGEAADRRAFDADAAAYLAREDAARKDRVRALVRRAEGLPR